jgi:hypothetical protein
MAGAIRIFTVTEANALLPQLEPRLAQLLAMVRGVEAKVAQWQGQLRGAVPDLRPLPGEPADVAAVKAELRGLIASLRAAWGRIEATGAVIEDVHQGRVDFRAQRDGRPVWLCWQRGEAAVSHWHAPEADFADRQPLGETSDCDEGQGDGGGGVAGTSAGLVH